MKTENYRKREIKNVFGADAAVVGAEWFCPFFSSKAKTSQPRFKDTSHIGTGCQVAFGLSIKTRFVNLIHDLAAKTVATGMKSDIGRLLKG